MHFGEKLCQDCVACEITYYFFIYQINIELNYSQYL